MKKQIERNILIAFFLNFSFSVIELIGGLLTNSISILSDSIHDFGDALTIGASYFFEKKSKKKADNKYTYGYIRYSVLGGLFTTIVLIVGSIAVIYNAISRLFNPVAVNYNGMIIFALVGIIINLIAAYITRGNNSLNQKSVNLHMLEDVLGWIVVFIGAIVMRFTDISYIDPIISLGVAVFIFVNAFGNLKMFFNIFLQKTPDNIDVEHLKEHILEIDGVEDIHHIHVWSIDGYNNCATMHIVTKSNDVKNIKNMIRKELYNHGISHTLLETEEEVCDDVECNAKVDNKVHIHKH